MRRDSICNFVQVISGFKIELDLIQIFINYYPALSMSDETTVLCWIPSHVGISGNDKAHTAVKSALRPLFRCYKADL